MGSPLAESSRAWPKTLARRVLWLIWMCEWCRVVLPCVREAHAASRRVYAELQLKVGGRVQRAISERPQTQTDKRRPCAVARVWDATRETLRGAEWPLALRWQPRCGAGCHGGCVRGLKREHRPWLYTVASYCTYWVL